MMRSRCRRLLSPLAAFLIGCAATEAPADPTALACDAEKDAPEMLLGRTTPGYMLEEGLMVRGALPVECPPGARASGGRCFSTQIECPEGSRKNSRSGKCVADVACPPGSEWSDFTCSPITDETRSTLVPLEALAPKPPTSGPRCTLFINSVPSSIPAVDGHPLPSTPQHVVVSPGVHNVTFVHPERGEKRLSVRCGAGEKLPALVKFD